MPVAIYIVYKLERLTECTWGYGLDLRVSRFGCVSYKWIYYIHLLLQMYPLNLLIL